MNSFNGYTKIELEMLREQAEKAFPAFIECAPIFANMIKANYDALKAKGFKGPELIQLTVGITAKQIGC